MANVCRILIFSIFFGILTDELYAANLISSSNRIQEIEVGVIVDMGSWVGKTIHACISMAISDFYETNSHYTTRTVLHVRDSHGRPLGVLSAAVDLLENSKVHAIIGLETFLEDKFLAILTEKAKIPILSFAPSVTSNEFPYIVKIRSDEASQFDGIASIVKSFEWNDVVLIYEYTNKERTTIPHWVKSFEGKNIHISYRSVISLSSKDNEILKELHKITTLETKIYVVHMSLSLASRLLVNAKRLGMMKDEYVWIITDKAMNSVHSMDFDVIESLQGTLGFKANIAESSKLQNVTARWRREFHYEDPKMVSKELPVVGIWAYDTMQALAEAVERVETLNAKDQVEGFLHSHGGMVLLHELSQVRFEGLSGEFELGDGKLYPEEFNLVNVQDNEERRMGVWMPKDGSFRELNSSVCSFNHSKDSNSFTCHRGYRIIPRGALLQTRGRKKLRIGVPVKPSFKELVDVRYDPQTNATIISGYCIDVFESAVKALRHELLYEFIPMPDGSYNDYLQQVYLQAYDAVVGDVTITSNRSQYVDFTLPFTELGVGMVARLDDKDPWFFLKPFSKRLWMVSAGSFILTGFVVWLIEHPINEEFQGPKASQLGTIVWFAASTLVYAHREKLKSNISKFVVGVWLFVVLILTSSYTANLSSLLTVQRIKLVKGDSIGANAFVQGFTVSNLNFQDNMLMPYPSPERYDEALRRGSKNGGAGAIIDEIPYIKLFLSKYPHDYAMIESQETTNGFGFAFQKGSPLAHEMSKAIARLREKGKLREIEKKWFRSQSSPLSRDTEMKTSRTLGVNRFFGLFLISGISKAVAILLFFIFVLHQKLSKSCIFRCWPEEKLCQFFRNLFF
ncbi:glutamate receptor 2.7-like [Olea europaea var. sylvestris]|uniref:glutamate receptor 2.7-like n=1 Tax=Olea europaea var. sylvestris TaxID=158386 RepID=UPI000C1D4372|nr:glutamate receptor 2.7-like [Olea europaea var. sylvestris]